MKVCNAGLQDGQHVSAPAASAAQPVNGMGHEGTASPDSLGPAAVQSLPNGGGDYHLLDDSEEEDDQQARAMEQVFGQVCTSHCGKALLRILLLARNELP